MSDLEVYAIYSAGPTVGGKVAIFGSENDALEYVQMKNKQTMFSPT